MVKMCKKNEQVYKILDEIAEQARTLG